ncbi:MAG: ABC transporter substrate-binding protein [Gallionellaceae bacterium]
MKKLLAVILGVCFSGVVTLAQAQAPAKAQEPAKTPAPAKVKASAKVISPDVLIDNIVQGVLVNVQQDKAIMAGDQQKLLALVDAKVLPNFNFAAMTRSAVGKYWRKASAEQRQKLISQFRTVMVRTYASQVKAISNVTIVVTKFTKKKLLTAEAKKSAKVKTTVLKVGSPKITIVYEMEMEKVTEGWKCVDIFSEGISIVRSNRSSYENVISKNDIISDCIDDLIKSLVEFNRRKAESK